MINQYQNPIIRGMHPDPSVVRVGDHYYLANSTFEYYPGVTVMESDDLLNWQTLGGVATVPEQADLRTAKSNEGIFAANIRYHDGYFYVITTNFAEFKTFIIRGKLTADGQRIDWEKSRITVNVPGIDPDLYFEDGHTYVQFTGYIDKKGTKAIRQVEINLATGAIIHEPEILTYGTGGRDVEGPHIYKKDDYYYLLTAEGGTGAGHMITIFRSKALWGPYEDAQGINPLFTNRDRAEEPLQNIGHGDLFTDPDGNWWMVCLGTRPAAVDFKQITNLGRETLLYPVNWENGWPKVYNGVPSKVVDLTAFPKHRQALKDEQRLTDFKDDFSEQRLRPEWLSLRDSLGDHLTLEDNSLVLRGNGHTLHELTTPAFIGLRQTEQEESLTVQLKGDNSQLNNGSFGIAAIINADNYAALLLEDNGNGKVNVIREQRLDDIFIHQEIGELNELPVDLKLVNTKDEKQFAAISTDGTEISYSTKAIHLSNEAIAALNTGDVEGLYVTGDAKLVVNEVTRTSK